jgi:transcriptional regulator with XRE-family HTH domain
MSTARLRQLGSWLARLRADAGCGIAEAAECLGCSGSKIRHLEAGRSRIRKSDLDKLLDRYAVPADIREQLEDIRRSAGERGWWSSYRLPEWFTPYVEFESFAAEADNFELDVVPGLLQTERYAYEVHRASRYTTNPQDIRRRVRARIARQDRLVGEQPLRFRAVVAESALHRRVGGAEVMREQIDRIVDRCRQPNVVVQVLPHAAGAHASPSPFVVLSFPCPEEESIGFVDTPLGGHTIDDPDDVAALRYVFDELRSCALSSPDTLDLLRNVRDARYGREEIGA